MILQNSTLSQRGFELAEGPSIYEFLTMLSNDMYHTDDNPSGFISLAVAENHPMLVEVAQFINRNINITCRDTGYGEGPWGSQRLRKAMASFISRNFNTQEPVNPENLMFTSGVTSLCEMLGFTLGDPGDAILFSRPIYQTFRMDFGQKAKVKCVHASFGDVDQFNPDAAAKYEEALLKAQAEGTCVRGIMLCNPHNPLGRCYSKDTIISLMRLCDKYKVHLLCDELYAMSVYSIDDPHAVPFCSALSFDSSPYIAREYLHVIYGMSKDFSANGLRVGCVYTRNEELLRSLRSFTQFHWASNPSQSIFAAMLENEDWLYNFLDLSRETLRKRSELAKKILDNAGIRYCRGANAGFFLVLDLRAYILPGLNGELNWEGEKILSKGFIKNKVLLTPGADLSAEEPGYFRIIFAHEEQTLRVGLDRVLQTLLK